MTEINGGSGAQAEAWANRPPLGNPQANIPQPQGPFVPQEAPLPSVPEVFDAGDMWKVGYNFHKAGVKAEGEVPFPTQSRIDRFERAEATLAVELEMARRDAVEAQNKLEAKMEGGEESESLPGREELMAEVDRAFEQKEKVLKAVRDSVADFCAGSPTKAQISKLPENVLVGFSNYLKRHLNPNA